MFKIKYLISEQALLVGSSGINSLIFSLKFNIVNPMSKRYIQLKEKMNDELKPISDALALVKESANAKFDETIETHIKLGINASKTDQKVGASVDLPHGAGKSKRVAVFT